MTDQDPQPPPAPVAAADDPGRPEPGSRERAALVDRLYDVAMDPIRLEELLDVWEGHAAPLRAQGAKGDATLDDPDLDPHIDRAAVFLDRYRPAPDARHGVLDDIPRSAAFLADGGPGITACNRAARMAFGIADGSPFSALPFDRDEIDTLRGVIRKIAHGQLDKAVTLRLRSSTTGSVVIMRVGPVETEDRAPLALVVSTELVWPEGFADTVQEAFGLTVAETDIVRGITLGLPVRDIAEARGRSAETVRTQLRSILSKTETHSQQELVRVVLGLMDVAMVPGARATPDGPTAGLERIEPQALRRGGRRLEWIEFGDPAGAPVVFMHLDFGLIRWPLAAERAARARGLRVVVPLRAWFGGTSPLPRGTDHLTGVTEDYAAVLDHLGLREAVVIPQGADLRFALNLSILRPDLVRAVLGCATQLPARTPAQYERMDKWQRFILANARYAPRVLPFIVKAGFSLARGLGPEGFFRKVNGGSPADMAAFDDPAIRAAVISGAAQALLHPTVSGAAAFSQECLGSERDWSGVVRAARVPVRLLQGDQDPQSPVQTIRELMADFPHLDVRFVPQTGQLLFFARWPEVLDEVERLLGRNT